MMVVAGLVKNCWAHFQTLATTPTHTQPQSLPTPPKMINIFKPMVCWWLGFWKLEFFQHKFGYDFRGVLGRLWCKVCYHCCFGCVCLHGCSAWWLWFGFGAFFIYHLLNMVVSCEFLLAFGSSWCLFFGGSGLEFVFVCFVWICLQEVCTGWGEIPFHPKQFG